MSNQRSGLGLEQNIYASGRLAADDSFVINNVYGISPFGNVLCSLGSDYAIEIAPDGTGRAWFGEIDLTPSNGTGRAWYIRDQLSGDVWSAFYNPTFENVDEYEVSYSPGQVRVYTLKNKIACILTISTVPEMSCEVWHVCLQNRSAEERQITFTTYVEPSFASPFEIRYLEDERAILMRPPLESMDMNPDFGVSQDLILFHCSTLQPIKRQVSKSEFTGENGSLAKPEHLNCESQLPADGIFDDVITSLTIEVELPIEGTADFGFCFGLAGCTEDALEIVRAFNKTQAVIDVIENARGHWKRMCSSFRINTSDKNLDALVNTWLPYETYAEWLSGRNAEAYLDPHRLADVLRRLYPFAGTAPEHCRNAILSFATGISLLGAFSTEKASLVELPPEELLWLAVSTARYVSETGDTEILSEAIPISDEIELTIADHCLRIIRMCVNDDRAKSAHNANSLLEQTIKQWSLISGNLIEFTALLEKMASNEKSLDDDGFTGVELPAKAKYLQSFSPTLSDKKLMLELIKSVGSSCYLDNNAGVECALYYGLIEELLGISATNHGLIVNPKLPASLCECSVVRHYKGDTYEIHINRPAVARSGNNTSIIVDGEPLLGDTLPYFGDGGNHTVIITIG